MPFQSKILVWEQDPSLQLLYQTFFESDGFAVLIANTTNEALGLFQSERPSLLLCDLFQPNKAVFHTLKKIKAVQRHFPIIAIVEPIDQSYWRSISLLDETIGKTGDLRELKMTVHRQLERCRALLAASGLPDQLTQFKRRPYTIFK